MLEERRKAADSLASVLAVYDGFCNLKQVRPSVLPKTLSIFVTTTLLLFARVTSGFYSMAAVQSTCLFGHGELPI